MNKLEKTKKVAELKSTLQRLNDTFDRGEVTRETFNEYTQLFDDAIDHHSGQAINSKLIVSIQESPVYELIDLIDNKFLRKDDETLLTDDDFCDTLGLIYNYNGEAQCDVAPDVSKWVLTMQKNLDSLGVGDELFDFFWDKVVPTFEQRC